MSLIKQYGRMWARNLDNIERIPGHTDGGLGVYVLYDGSTPIYVGMGNIRQRIRQHRQHSRRGKMWDHFSWYVPTDPAHMRDIEALLLSTLPFYLRALNRQTGRIPGKLISRSKTNQQAEPIDRVTLPPFRPRNSG